MTDAGTWGAVIEALRQPEEFAQAWDRSSRGQRPASWLPIFAVFFLTAVLGTAAYGLTMGFLGGAPDMISKSWKAVFAAGGASATALPTLYIFYSILGSQLR